MEVRYSFEGRTERLIAGGRVALAAFTLVAITLDPSDPAKHAAFVYRLMAAYAGYALLLAGVVWTALIPIRPLAFITHGLDLTLSTILIYLTAGSTSPFFVFFIFSILCSTLRWQWRGTLWTTGVSLGAFLAVGSYDATAVMDPDFELNRLIIRATYMGIVGAFVGYLSAHEHQHRSHIAKLAAWPRSPSIDIEDALQQVMQYAGKMLRIPRVLMAWEETDEPWLHLALVADAKVSRWREAASEVGPLVPRALEGKSFFSKDATGALPVVVGTAASSDLQRWHGEPISAALRRRFDIRSVVSTAISGENLKGRIFFLDRSNLDSDDLTVAGTVADHVATSLELFYFLQHLQQTVTVAERTRMSRDLHDGVLQSLTAGGLRLRAALELMKSDPQAAIEHLHSLQEIIVQEQRDLRSFIEILRLPLANAASEFKLLPALHELSRTIERQWGTRVELMEGGLVENIPTPLAREVYYLVREGLVNAGRHAHGSQARVEIKTSDQQVSIDLADDGRGFSFKGEFDHAALVTKGLGPAMLKSRVTSLGGRLNVHSSEAGARLHISLPIEGREA